MNGAVKGSVFACIISLKGSLFRNEMDISIKLPFYSISKNKLFSLTKTMQKAEYNKYCKNSARLCNSKR